MSNSNLTLNAEVRTITGKKVAQLRNAGKVPGVVYGPVVSETVQVSVDRREFERFYRANGHTTLFTLTWNGGRQPVFIREVQEDHLKRMPLHIDFFAPNLRQTLRTLVPVVLINHADQVDGILTEARTEVEVESLPTAVPQQLDVDISHLTAIGDMIHVSNIVAPEGVTIITPEDELLAHLIAPAVEPEPEVEETEEGEEEVLAEAEGAAEADAEGVIESE